MVGRSTRDRWRRFDDIEAAHRVRRFAHAPAAGEITRIDQASRPIAKEIRIQADDHIGTVEMEDWGQRLAEQLCRGLLAGTDRQRIVLEHAK